MKSLNYILFASLILFSGCQKDDSDEAETIVSNSAVNPVASFTSSQQGQDLESRYTWNFSSVLENTSVLFGILEMAIPQVKQTLLTPMKEQALTLLY
jgi:hypothetical protein